MYLYTLIISFAPYFFCQHWWVVS